MSYADEVRELINKKKTEENDFVKEIKCYFEQKLTKKFLKNVLKKNLKKYDIISGSLEFKIIVTNSTYEEECRKFKIDFRTRYKKIACLKIPTRKYKYVDFDYVCTQLKLELESLLKTRMEELGFARICSKEYARSFWILSYYYFTWQ